MTKKLRSLTSQTPRQKPHSLTTCIKYINFYLVRDYTKNMRSLTSQRLSKIWGLWLVRDHSAWLVRDHGLWLVRQACFWLIFITWTNNFIVSHNMLELLFVILHHMLLIMIVNLQNYQKYLEMYVLIFPGLVWSKIMLFVEVK